MKRQTTTKTTTATRTSTRKSTVVPAMDIQRELKPTNDDIRRRAYEIYLDRMQTGSPGSSDSDWSRAERELFQR